MNESLKILAGMVIVFICGWYLRGILAPRRVPKWITQDQRRAKDGRFQKTAE